MPSPEKRSYRQLGIWPNPHDDKTTYQALAENVSGIQLYNAHVMNLVRRVTLAALPFLVVGCDPGISIRQVNSAEYAPNEKTTLDDRVVVNAKTKLQFIGDTRYMPEVKVTNASGSPITVFSIDLSTRKKTYTSKVLPPPTFPLTIQSGSTETIGIDFNLDEDVQKTFQQTAELWVHYWSGGKQEIARAHLESGPP
jgi:hypothetical protein